MLVHVAREFTFTSPPANFVHEAFVETQDQIPMSGIGWDCNIHLQVSVTDDSIVQMYANEIVVSRVSCADELFGDVSARSATVIDCGRQTAWAMYGMYTPA